MTAHHKDKGIAREELMKTCRSLGLSKTEFAAIIGTPQESIPALIPFETSLGETATSVMRLSINLSIDSLGDQTTKKAWIHRSSVDFPNTPAKQMQTPDGLKAVERYLLHKTMHHPLAEYFASPY